MDRALRLLALLLLVSLVMPGGAERMEKATPISSKSHRAQAVGRANHESAAGETGCSVACSLCSDRSSTSFAESLSERLAQGAQPSTAWHLGPGNSRRRGVGRWPYSSTGAATVAAEAQALARVQV